MFGAPSHFLAHSCIILTILLTKTIISSCKDSVVSVNYLILQTANITFILLPATYKSIYSSVVVKVLETILAPSSPNPLYNNVLILNIVSSSI